MSELLSAAKDRAPKLLSEPDPQIPWSWGMGGIACLRILGLRQAGSLAVLGYRLGMFGGRGRTPSLPPHTLFTPRCARLVWGVMVDSGLSWIEEEAQKYLREAGGLLIDVKHCARVEEGRRRLARGWVHTSLGLGGARPLRT